MGVSMNGLVSNMDTDSIVSAMVSGYVARKDKLVKQQTRLEWTQDVWKELNKKVYSFYTDKLSPMRFSNAFQVKKATSSNESKAKVTASTAAVNGTQNLKINQLAKTGYLTGGVVKSTESGKKISGSSKLSQLGITSNSSVSLIVGGAEKKIEIKQDMSVDQLVAAFKDAGVNASFDEGNQRFFVSSKVSGAEADFSFTANSADGMDALKKMGLFSVTEADMKGYEKFANYTDADIEKMAKNDYTRMVINKEITDKKNLSSDLSLLMKQIETDVKNDNVPSDLKDMVIKDADGNILGYDLDKYRDYLNTLTKDDGSLTDAAKAKVERLDRIEASGLISDTSNVNKEYLNDQVKDLQEEIEERGKVLKDEALFADELQKLEDNGEFDASNADYQGIIGTYNTQRATAQDVVQQYDIIKNYEKSDTHTEAETAAYNAAKAALGVGDNDGTGAVRIVGQDAQIELNGAIYNSNTSTFQVNGLTIQANATTEPGEVISINTDVDAQGIYDTVKDFFKSYNELIKEMETLFNADSSKGYEPLTDDEKDAMSDKEVEKWEKKIKDSLLRRDSTLDSIMTAVKGAMMSTFEIGDKKYSLSSFGIKTSNYFTSGENEKGVFHIDGDKDDEKTKGNTDKLMAAIASDPEAVAEFFNKLSTKVYDTLTKKMSRSSLSSAYTIYNDKYMEKQQNNYKSQISKWEDRIKTMEDRYRKQFTAMEKALAKLNSNSSSLISMLGM